MTAIDDVASNAWERCESLTMQVPADSHQRREIGKHHAAA